MNVQFRGFLSQGFTSSTSTVQDTEVKLPKHLIALERYICLFPLKARENFQASKLAMQISNANLQQPTEKRVQDKVLTRHCWVLAINIFKPGGNFPFSLISSSSFPYPEMSHCWFYSHFSKGCILQLLQQLLCVPEYFSALLSTYCKRVQNKKTS